MSQTRPPADRTLANLERTRQQIQELDQLLQQMLALPVSEDKSPARPASSPASAVPQPLGPASSAAPAEAAVFQPWTADDRPAPPPADAPASALPLAPSTEPSEVPPTPWLCPPDGDPVQTAPVQTATGRPSRSAPPGGSSSAVREWLLWLGLVLAVAVVGLSLGVWLGWNW